MNAKEEAGMEKKEVKSSGPLFCIYITGCLHYALLLSPMHCEIAESPLRDGSGNVSISRSLWADVVPGVAKKKIPPVLEAGFTSWFLC